MLSPSAYPPATQPVSERTPFDTKILSAEKSSKFFIDNPLLITAGAV